MGSPKRISRGTGTLIRRRPNDITGVRTPGADQAVMPCSAAPASVRRATHQAAWRAFSSKLSVTDGDVVAKMANDHPESIRRDRARLLENVSSPHGGLRSSVATCGEPSDGTLNAACADVCFWSGGV